MSLRRPDPEYLRLILPYGVGIQELALAARKLILEEAPGPASCLRGVHHRRPLHVHGATQRRVRLHHHTCHWVNLGFNFGSLLPDPDGLLRGEGN